MSRLLVPLSWLLLLSSIASGTATLAASLPPEARQLVGTATFEVVVKKPIVDSLTYERPLPLELLSYTERTDEYESIGTAFSIGNHQYVSAAHVFGSSFLSQFGEPALRDAAGNVYLLDKVLKYSTRRDYIVFSLKNEPPDAAWPVNREPVLNEPIFAVGNALGEGIVIRDGLFTSQTPEQLDGEWKWIRFSAAASPGNSGGPLLDQEGRVIGVVLRKSPNENLNYAAPMSLVLDGEASGRVDGRYTYWLPNMDITENTRLDEKFSLPDSYASLAKQIVDRMDTRYDEMQSSLLTKNSSSIFPNGEGSDEMLQSAYSASFPAIVSRNADGSWEALVPERTEDATLPRNGFASVGPISGVVLARIKRPDDVRYADFYHDSRLLMDYVLKASSVSRYVGSDAVRVTSLGAAKTEAMHTDAFGRIWQFRTWNIEYANMVVVAFTLPVPDGYVMLMRTVKTGSTHDALLDLRALTNFLNVSFRGSLEQWREFMKETAWLPRALEDVHIDYEYGKRFVYRSKRLRASFDSLPTRIEKDTVFTLRMSYLKQGDSVLWDASGMSLAEKDGDDAAFAIVRHSRPPTSLNDQYQTEWSTMVAREYPFNATIVEEGGRVAVDAIHPYPAPEHSESTETRVLYSLTYWINAKRSQEEMNTSLAAWSGSIEALEK